MTGVESGNMLTPSALISTETEDGQAGRKKEGDTAKHEGGMAKHKGTQLRFHPSEMEKILLVAKILMGKLTG